MNTGKKISIGDKIFDIWNSENTPKGAVGHVCEHAQDIGWGGRVKSMPDYSGGVFDAPVIHEDDDGLQCE